MMSGSCTVVPTNVARAGRHGRTLKVGAPTAPRKKKMTGMSMKKPGEPVGSMQLPASYTREQLFEYGWDEERKVFLRPKRGPWGSKLNNERWSNQGPRYQRKPSHYRKGTI